ncbi:ADP-ribosylglycohydrolase family protein [Collinsella aerofaciens]|uniref:ADP-ribosylglycohydrolase family protein n=1 Tax=Collinsella aerofaciens TaxID=74426 RepID=UPI001CD6603E|nr:ADP-ribosylglycohydrolase family protein [Collinsella aerofaciens]UBS35695.1 ADP-ribosylglycohydrolase family protein [Collinsella aerofaciens]
MTDRPKTTLRDCIYGLAVGDALGVPYEFRPRGTFKCTDMIGYGTHGQPAGTWSDDTSMTLATCDSIRELGHIDTADMRDKFVRWIARGEYTIDGVFDYGGTTARALHTGKGGSGERDNGNGSLMRIAPLAFTDATDNEIREVSAITHAHRTSTDACIIFVELMRNVMNGALPSRALHLKGVPEQEIRSGGFVRDTLKAATWCFVNTTSYEDCVLVAVNLGDDTDTTAAVAGALAGTVYGIDAIPQEWTDALRGKELIEQCLF